MKSIEVIGIQVQATPGSSIGSCLQECLQLATQEWRNVTLKHNGRYYEIKVNDLLAYVEENEECK